MSSRRPRATSSRASRPPSAATSSSARRPKGCSRSRRFRSPWSSDGRPRPTKRSPSASASASAKPSSSRPGSSSCRMGPCSEATTSRNWSSADAKDPGPGRPPHHARGRRPADVDRLLGRRARHAVRVRAAQPRPPRRQPPLLRSRRRAADHDLQQRGPRGRLHPDVDGRGRRAPRGVRRLAGHLQAGGRAARRARDRPQRPQGPRLHGLDLLRGPARAPDRACALPLRAAARLHARGGAARGAQDPGGARGREHRPGAPGRRNRDARQAIAGAAIGGGVMAEYTVSILTPSVNNLTVRIFLRAAGLDFEEKDVWGKKDEPDFVQKDPAQLTPMLEESGLPRGSLWESCAIMQYLCNKHGLDRFYPTDPGERAMTDSAMFYLVGTLYPYLARATYPTLGFPQYAGEAATSGADDTVKAQAAKDAEAALAQPLEAFRSFYLADDRFIGGGDGPSIADIRLAVTLEFLDSIDYDLPDWAQEHKAAVEEALGDAYSEPAADVRGFVASVKAPA